MDKAKAIVGQFLEAQDRLVLQASDLSLETLASMVQRGAVDVAPHYQRRERWSAAQQSALIESFVLNVPVPPIYLAEDDFGRYSIIDGKQRITTIKSFLFDRLRLTALESFPNLNGLTFAELPEEIRNALTVRPYVRVVTLLKQSDPQLKYEVFTRLNKGGEPLNAQEIRNVAFRGSLNEMIYELADNKFLRAQLKIAGTKSPAFRNMSDAEYVLRFLTMSKVWRNFSGSFTRSMDTFMRENQNLKNEKLAPLRGAFQRSISACQAIWGKNAFKRPADGGWRDQLIAGMYDAQMISVSLLSDPNIASLTEHRRQVTDATIKLFKADKNFDEAVRLGTNTPSRVKYRVETMLAALKHYV